MRLPAAVQSTAIGARCRCAALIRAGVGRQAVGIVRGDDVLSHGLGRLT